MLEILRNALRTPESWWTLASNAIPVIGVLFFGWAALPLLIYYWIENVLIGAFNVPKILIAGLTKPAPQSWLSFFLAPFFIVHYGIFCFVHGIFIFAMFEMADVFAGHSTSSGDAFDVSARVTGMLQEDSDLRWAVLGLIAVLAFRFVWLWLMRGAWRKTDPMRQMFEPYGRIVVLHVTILIVAFPVALIGQPVIAVLCLAIFKTALELGMPLIRFPAESKEPA